ncbi:UDP-N-acetylmuramate--L-alanine ligase [Flavobacterium sp.]|jgi:UDP-N-acetylmuramate--alanine ligase|uniref:UDP-N-acetylmuramate--L-alanine ligase n=1 Tax=Flavobacterium sp. TaxID=239 RepID=UPI002A812A1C|nr:UDP-N-acetylmuramate--L-alanine ligase [Flavobacterium sp.]
MNLNQIHNIYFIGIGGIGMSALARHFMNIGKNVAGYDKTKTILTNELIALGMDIHFEDNLDLIDKKYLDKTNTLVIITPAVPKDHSEWNYFLSEGFEVKKRAEVLGLITKDTFCFAIAGTHGKTTTSSILGHILFQSGVDVTSFLGGIVENYNSNIIGDGKTVTVVEADEFDRSFLHLHPNLACITSMDADHLDIYGDASAIEASFVEFSNKVTSQNLFIAKGLPLNGNTIGINEEATFSAQNIRIENGFYVFDVKMANEVVENVKFALPGHHNLSNALIAFAMAKNYGVSNDNIISALASFKGVRRRFSFQTRTENIVYIDDYAHHPTEINAVHQAVRELYPNKKIIAAFQPHLFSRTKDFVDGFAESLSQFDEVLLLEIYPARELPMQGVNSSWLLSKISNKNKKLITKEGLLQEFKNSDANVYVTIGAGDIGEMVSEIKKIVDEKA